MGFLVPLGRMHFSISSSISSSCDLAWPIVKEYSFKKLVIARKHCVCLILDGCGISVLASTLLSSGLWSLAVKGVSEKQTFVAKYYTLS